MAMMTLSWTRFCKAGKTGSAICAVSTNLLTPGRCIRAKSVLGSLHVSELANEPEAASHGREGDGGRKETSGPNAGVHAQGWLPYSVQRRGQQAASRRAEEPG